VEQEKKDELAARLISVIHKFFVGVGPMQIAESLEILGLAIGGLAILVYKEKAGEEED